MTGDLTVLRVLYSVLAILGYILSSALIVRSAVSILPVLSVLPVLHTLTLLILNKTLLLLRPPQTILIVLMVKLILVELVDLVLVKLVDLIGHLILIQTLFRSVLVEIQSVLVVCSKVLLLFLVVFDAVCVLLVTWRLLVDAVAGIHVRV